MTSPAPAPAPHKHAGPVVTKEVRLAVPPAKAWEAWADPLKIAQWFVDRADGFAKAGGTVTWHFDAFDMHMPVPVVEAEPGKSYVIAGEIPGRPPFLQEVLIEQEGGSTILRLLNSGFGEGAAWEDEIEGVDSGWQLALAHLKLWLERYAPATRSHVFAMRPGRFEYAALLPFYGTAAGLESWLARAARIDREPLGAGSFVRLDLGEAGPLNGRVLAASNREFMIEWPEQRGALSLKAFACGPGDRAVALDFNAWGLDPARKPAIESRVQAALDRLQARLATP